MTIYFIQYLARPGASHADHDAIGGAYVNCWIRADSPELANGIASAEIAREGWTVEAIEESPEIRLAPSENDAEYHEQAALDGECYVFHHWPVGAEDDDGIELDRVVIVVDPAFGERLRNLPSRVPVWIADTAINRAAAEALRGEQPDRAHADVITTFAVDEGEGPADWCAGVLGAVELHHGEHAQDPPYSTVQVWGVALTSELATTFRARGFTSFAPDSDGFVARRE